ncbi:MAG: undecaprenyl-diphosphate phosphatase [Spirochaetaceae bacterium]|jgi:undecaprenyl-diphosphatase|nr:undecaprenyl-diphosphate phosphatase [Spirochaetaceae bacterium]
MGIVEALILGALQGITEFLPVSSSGHLVLLQRILGIREPALLFDTLVHGGTLAAGFVVLRRDIGRILCRPLQPLTGLLIAATIPTVIIALIFKDPIEGAFASGAWLGFAFLTTACALALSEFAAKKPGTPRPGTAMNWLDALIIGILQGVAIIPGVSRSGLTLSGAISRRLDRDFAARFSFLLSIPAILGALVFQLKDLVRGGGGSGAGIGPDALIAGTAAAAVVGFFSVRFMLKLVRSRSLRGFAVYTALLGILVLFDQHISHVFF